MTLKPRLRKWRYAPLWSCVSAGYHEIGVTPDEAFERWQIARMLLPPAMGQDAMTAEFRSACGLTTH